MRYLGLDYGGKRIGIAISDTSGAFAFPRETIPNDANAIPALVELARKEGASAFVVGDTLSLGGEKNKITPQAEVFAAALAQASGLAVTPVREAWSSQEAARFAPAGKRHDDAAAAAIILQRFLDTHGTVH